MEKNAWSMRTVARRELHVPSRDRAPRPALPGGSGLCRRADSFSLRTAAAFVVLVALLTGVGCSRFRSPESAVEEALAAANRGDYQIADQFVGGRNPAQWDQITRRRSIQTVREVYRDEEGERIYRAQWDRFRQAGEVYGALGDFAIVRASCTLNTGVMINIAIYLRKDGQGSWKVFDHGRSYRLRPQG